MASTSIPLTTLTFTSAASTTVSSYQKIPMAQGSGHGAAQPDRALGFFATTTDSTGGELATMRIAFIEKTSKTVLAYEDVSLVSTSVRTGVDGSSGNYVCTVSCASTGKKSFDAIGALRGNVELRAGILSSAQAFGTITVYVFGDTEV